MDLATRGQTGPGFSGSRLLMGFIDEKVKIFLEVNRYRRRDMIVLESNRKIF
jgi:hypothetical protein